MKQSNYRSAAPGFLKILMGIIYFAVIGLALLLFGLLVLIQVLAAMQWSGKL